jgi:hypothetical protein
MLNILSGYFFFQCEQHAKVTHESSAWVAESNRYNRRKWKMVKRNVAQLAEREMNDNAAKSWRRECPSSNGVS